MVPPIVVVAAKAISAGCRATHIAPQTIHADFRVGLRRLTSRLLRLLHQAKRVKVRMNRLLVRVLVDLRVGHLADEFLRPCHHCAFHARVVDVWNDGERDQSLFKFNKLIRISWLRWNLLKLHVFGLCKTFLHRLHTSWLLISSL